MPDAIDLLVLDGAKAPYGEVLALVEARLRPGALIVADSADYSPDYLAHVRSPDCAYLSIPFADDVELSMRLGYVVAVSRRLSMRCASSMRCI
ncbi:hypothetical protein [Lysobacter sp. Hz 25]|uniref:hypothetical protein n=1 Tax=Lysobacter sp. Hz 25 TaxID=3383698 RepID=UPI0038D4536D